MFLQGVDEKKATEVAYWLPTRRRLFALLGERDDHPKPLGMCPCVLNAARLNCADQPADCFQFGVVAARLNSGNRGQWNTRLVCQQLLWPIQCRAASADGGSKDVCVWQIDHKNILLYVLFISSDCKLTVSDIKLIQMIGLGQIYGKRTVHKIVC